MAEGRRGLGRGLSALLDEVEAPAEGGHRAAGVTEIPVEAIKANPDQPRRHFDETELEELTGGRGVADVRRARASGTSAPACATSSKEALPPHLPREEHVLEPDASCPNCGNAMQALGEDVSEQLARVTAMFRVIRTIRRKAGRSTNWRDSLGPSSPLPLPARPP